jgi:hypothetical protein
MVDAIKVFIIFTGCTVLFYYAMLWINQEYQYYNRYQNPGDGAVKASATMDNEERSWFDRIVLLYLDGE